MCYYLNAKFQGQRVKTVHFVEIRLYVTKIRNKLADHTANNPTI